MDRQSNSRETETKHAKNEISSRTFRRPITVYDHVVSYGPACIG